MRSNAVIGSLTLALAATVLASCGSSNSDSSASGGYCDELKADKAYFESLSGSDADMSNLDQVFTKVHTLADDAPDNVADDWKTLDDAISTIETALKDAGLKPSDLAAMQKGQMPQGVDLSKLQELAPKLQSLSSGDVTTAANNIADDAKKTCDLDLASS
jgi:ABC-type phosphate/phosphonate transport system substrate-binding protein